MLKLHFIQWDKGNNSIGLIDRAVLSIIALMSLGTEFTANHVQF